jgi:hypothetical protein
MDVETTEVVNIPIPYVPAESGTREVATGISKDELLDLMRRMIEDSD